MKNAGIGAAMAAVIRRAGSTGRRPATRAASNLQKATRRLVEKTGLGALAVRYRGKGVVTTAEGGVVGTECEDYCCPSNKPCGTYPNCSAKKSCWNNTKTCGACPPPPSDPNPNPCYNPSSGCE